MLYRLRSKKRDRWYGVETPKDCYDYWSTYGAKTFKLINIQHSSIKLESKFHQVTAILLSLEREFEHCQRGLEDLGGDDQVGRGIQFFLDKKYEQKLEELGGEVQIGSGNVDQI